MIQVDLPIISSEILPKVPLTYHPRRSVSAYSLLSPIPVPFPLPSSSPSTFSSTLLLPLLRSASFSSVAAERAFEPVPTLPPSPPVSVQSPVFAELDLRSSY